ncbi:diguanylate cyclase domain-containing protein [Rhizobium sp. SGZ-381]|uniref:GGDEF domain-containing protein n=1 Tax=Rhizobium sp. SGZ-381 TaxID=3342800 RepID=UPI00366ACC62
MGGVSIWLLVAAIVMGLVIIAGTLRAPNAPGRKAFALSILMALWWMSCVLLRHSVEDFSTKLLLLKLTWLGITGTPLFWSLSFLAYARGRDSEKPWQLLAIAVTAVFFCVMALTNDWHHGLYRELIDPASMLYRHGWVYSLAMLVAYSAMAISCCSGIVLTLRSRGIHRWQLWALLMSALLPLTANVSYTAYGFMLFNDDPTPFVFAGTGAFMLGAQLFGRLFVLPPIGRDAIFALLPDPVIVLDEAGRILELNPAAARLPGIPAQPIGKFLREPFEITRFLFTLANGDGERHELKLSSNGCTYELSCHSLRPWGRIGGRMLVMRDISLRKADQLRLADLSRDLEERLSDNLRLQALLREEAIRDHLTGLYNRRHAQDILPAAMRQPVEPVPAGQQAAASPLLALAIVDIDHFKSFNDRFGHQTGDQVLQVFARLLQEKLGPLDSLFRWGGEEFLVLMPQTSRLEVEARCAQWKASLARTSLAGLDDAKLTFSAGIFLSAGGATTMDEAVKAADMALYRAKATGRDCYCIHGDEEPAAEPVCGPALSVVPALAMINDDAAATLAASG